MTVHEGNAEFVRSAASPADFLGDLPQVTLAGRSNVGKSSVINCLLQRHGLARVGSTPGRTAYVNYFRVDGAFYLADLPGYGYAKVSRAERARWGALMDAYFACPRRIALGLLVVDARHAPTRDDGTMAAWFRDTGRPLLVVANKLDRVRPAQVEGNLQCIRETLAPTAPLIPFSAEKGTGRGTLLTEILRVLDL